MRAGATAAVGPAAVPMLTAQRGTLTLVAAFPADALQPAGHLRSTTTWGPRSIRIGVIRGDDAAAWR